MARFDVEAALSAAGAGGASTAAPGPKRFRMPGEPSAGEREGRAMAAPLQGFITAMQGPTFGFQDELTGAVQGLKTILTGGGLDHAGQDYAHYRDMMRGATEQYRKDRPTLATLSSLAASMPVQVMLPTPKLPRLGSGMLADLGRAGTAAAIYSAITGLGETKADEPVAMLADAGKSAAIAAPVAAGGLIAGRTLGAMGAPIARMAAEGGNLGKSAQEMAQELAERKAASKVAEAFERDAPPGTVFTDGMVPTGDLLASGAQQMRPGISSAMDRAAARMGKLGDRAMVLDAGGKNVRRLADVIATMPGKTTEIINREQLARRATSADRLIQAADDALAAGGPAGRIAMKQGQTMLTGSLPGTIQALVAERSAASRPLYDQLHSMAVRIDAPMASALNAAKKLGAFTEGDKIATAEQRAFSLANAPIERGQTVSMADLDYAKRGLDRLVEAQTGAVTGTITATGRAFGDLRESLRNALDDLTVDPETGQSLYAAARSAYAGPSRMIEAANLGRRALDADKSGRIADDIAGLGESEMDAFRVGVLQAIKDKAGSKAGRSQLLSYWENPNVGDKLKTAFGGSFKQFAAALMREEKLRGINAIDTNSQTAARLKAAEDLGEDAVADSVAAVANVKSGNVGGFLDRMRALLTRSDMPESVRDEVGRLLTMKGPAAQARLRQMDQQLRAVQAARANRAASYGAMAGGTAGRFTTQQGNE